MFAETMLNVIRPPGVSLATLFSGKTIMLVTRSVHGIISYWLPLACPAARTITRTSTTVGLHEERASVVKQHDDRSDGELCTRVHTVRYQAQVGRVDTRCQRGRIGAHHR
jgi:hypothetical protein